MGDALIKSGKRRLREQNRVILLTQCILSVTRLAINKLLNFCLRQAGVLGHCLDRHTILKHSPCSLNTVLFNALFNALLNAIGEAVGVQFLFFFV